MVISELIIDCAFLWDNDALGYGPILAKATAVGALVEVLHRKSLSNLL
jgi:hypothetical protein